MKGRWLESVVMDLKCRGIKTRGRTVVVKRVQLKKSQIKHTITIMEVHGMDTGGGRTAKAARPHPIARPSDVRCI